jgi:hypothetical protein
MSKFLLLNNDNVIIDIVDVVKYVKKNTNGLVVLCLQSQAQGYIASNGSDIYPKAGEQLIPTYCDIAREVQVSEDACEGITALAYRYDFDTESIVENTEPYPVANIVLANQMSKINADIEYIAMMSDVEI